ncbi:MAG: asparagine synthase (glutamine-hydrolyzing) [Desulfobacteraceae bacterium]|nr:asparagine synthase (glutamine-hydrolyzing) [Desulfobacteraceae bacterium]
MCGITGLLNRSFPKEQWDSTLRSMAGTISHRGPDDEGIWYDASAGVGLAHRRLSVIDLTDTGHQPMKSDDNNICIVYNGEIYNFMEIRKTLETYGHRFKSSSDTEVVLKAYQQWGTDCLEKLTGMFALALWDKNKHSLVLARDRLGIKPLYYYFSNNVFLFASELKALMAFKFFPKDIAHDSIPLFLHYQYIPAPRTVFKNTYKLLPGHFLTCDGKNITVRPYWKHRCLAPDLTTAQDMRFSEEDHLQELDEILTKAVSDHLVSDVPLGALLSGGIDSSIVVALMQKVNTSRVRTFSIGFREKGYNEAPWAARVAEHLGTDHTEFYVTPGEAMNVIRGLPDIYDEPFADASAIPTFLVSRTARSFVTVALSGDGGDEQFAGYVRYWSTCAMHAFLQRFPGTVNKKISSVLGNLPSAWVEKCYLPWRRILPQRFRVTNFADKWQKLVWLIKHTDIMDIYRMTVCLWSEDELGELLANSMTNQERGFYTLPGTRYEETFEQTEGMPLLSRLMQADQKTYLPDAMLTKVDRASMGVGLEIRVPLLDHRVVEYTSGLPDSLKYKNGQGKYILRKLLARYVPEQLFERPKMGFGVPIDRWFRNELNPMLMDYLSPERLKNEGLFDHTLVEQKINEHMSGKISHQYRLWTLLMWEMWREQWLE